MMVEHLLRLSLSLCISALLSLSPSLGLEACAVLLWGLASYFSSFSFTSSSKTTKLWFLSSRYVAGLLCFVCWLVGWLVGLGTGGLLLLLLCFLFFRHRRIHFRMYFLPQVRCPCCWMLVCCCALWLSLFFFCCCCCCCCVVIDGACIGLTSFVKKRSVYVIVNGLLVLPTFVLTTALQDCLPL